MWYFTWILGTGFAIFFAIVFGLLFDIRQENNKKTSSKENK